MIENSQSRTEADKERKAKQTVLGKIKKLQLTQEKQLLR